MSTVSDIIETKIPIDLGFGIDTKTDPKLVIKTKLLRLENAQILQTGQITSRWGTQSLPNQDTIGLAISSGQALGVLDNELLEVGQSSIYSFNAAQAANFSKKGALTTVGVNRRIAASNLSNLQSVNAASANGVTVYAWDSVATNTLSWMVVDESSGTVYQSGSHGAVAQTPQLVVVGSAIVLIYATAVGAVVMRKFDTLHPYTVPGVVSPGGMTLSGTMVIGAATDGATTIMVAGTNNGGGVTIATYNPSTLALVTSAALTPGFGPPFISISYFPVASSGCNWGIAYPDLVGNLKASFYSTNLATVFSYTVLTTTAANPVGPACMRQSPSDSNKIIIYATVFSTQSTANPCGQSVTGFAIRISSGGRYTPIFTNNLFAMGAQLASFPWSTGVGTTANILVQYQVDPTIVWNNPTTTQPPQSSQPSEFILDADTGVLVGSGPPAQAMVAGLSLSGVSAYPVLPAPAALGSNRFLIGRGASLYLASQGSKYVFGQGVGELLLDYGLARAIFLEQLKSNSHITGGLLQRYDGQGIAEHGFTLAPEFLSAQGNGSSLIDIAFAPPTAANPSSTTLLTFPSGAQMYPGEWWAIDGSAQVLGTGSNIAANPTDYFWYRINGQGADPAPLTAGGHVVDILSTDTSLQVAQKTSVIVSGRVSGNVVVNINGASVLELQSSINAFPAAGTGLSQIPTVQSGKFRIAETVPAVNGGVSTTARAYSIACPPGAFISPSQYFIFNLGVGNGAGFSYVAYVWFKVNGVGTDPGFNAVIPGIRDGNTVRTVGVEVDVLSSDTAANVATKVYNALLAGGTTGPGIHIVATGNIPASGTNGSFVFLNLFTSAAGTLPDAVVPEIGANISVGSGALGLANGAGTTQTSSVQYVGVYAETDGKGNIHRSAPSVPLTVICPRSPVNDARVSVSFPNYHITNKGSQVILELYRTSSNALIPSKITPSLTPVANSPGTASTTIPDSLQDFRAPGDTLSAQLFGNEILYTYGGGLQHDVMAPCSIAHTHRGRVWLGGFADDPYRAQASLLEPQGRGVAFSNDVSHTLQLAQDGGPIVAYGSLSEKLVIFKESGIYWTAGDGPDSTGQNGAFLVPEKLNTQAGCDAPKSVLETPLGLVFSTEKGWFLLDGNLQVTHMEAADAYNTFPVTSGAVNDVDEVCRWTTLNGPTICWNYIRNAWSINPNTGAADSVVYAPHVPGQVESKTYYYLTADGKVHQEITGTFTDDGTGFSWLMQSAWIKPGDQVAGIARVRKAIWLGLWPALQYSTLTIEYNFNEPGCPPATTETMNLTATGNGGFWGDGASWGADASWGGPALVGQDVVRWRAYVPHQKCTAFRFTLQTIYPFQTTRAVAISNLTLEAAIKKGVAKLPVTQSIGS